MKETELEKEIRRFRQGIDDDNEFIDLTFEEFMGGVIALTPAEKREGKRLLKQQNA